MDDAFFPKILQSAFDLKVNKNNLHHNGIISFYVVKRSRLHEIKQMMFNAPEPMRGVVAFGESLRHCYDVTQV